jgi:hypothetical protein
VTLRCGCGGALEINGALSHYGPESAVEVYTCASCGKEHKKRFEA